MNTRNTVVNLDVPVSVAAGTASSLVDNHDSVVVLASGTFTGTYQVQVSGDGTNWTNFGTALTAAGNLPVTILCSKVRLNCTAYTSGTPVFLVMGKPRS
jgi:hypothetical protein